MDIEKTRIGMWLFRDAVPEPLRLVVGAHPLICVTTQLIITVCLLMNSDVRRGFTLVAISILLVSIQATRDTRRRLLLMVLTVSIFLALLYCFLGKTSGHAYWTWPWGSSFGEDTIADFMVAWCRIIGVALTSAATVSAIGFNGLIWLLDRKRLPRVFAIPAEVMVIYFWRLQSDFESVVEAYAASRPNGEPGRKRIGIKTYVPIAGTFFVATLARIREMSVGLISRSLHQKRTVDIYRMRTSWLRSIIYAVAAIAAAMTLFK